MHPFPIIQVWFWGAQVLAQPLNISGTRTRLNYVKFKLKSNVQCVGNAYLLPITHSRFSYGLAWNRGRACRSNSKANGTHASHAEDTSTIAQRSKRNFTTQKCKKKEHVYICVFLHEVVGLSPSILNNSVQNAGTGTHWITSVVNRKNPATRIKSTENEWVLCGVASELDTWSENKREEEKLRECNRFDVHKEWWNRNTDSTCSLLFCSLASQYENVLLQAIHYVRTLFAAPRPNLVNSNVVRI